MSVAADFIVYLSLLSAVAPSLAADSAAERELLAVADSREFQTELAVAAGDTEYAAAIRAHAAWPTPETYVVLRRAGERSYQRQLAAAAVAALV